MAQDLREMLKNKEGEVSKNPPKGHEKRFGDRLDKNFHIQNKTNRFYWFKIAAVLIVFLGIGYLVFKSLPVTDENVNSIVLEETEKKQVDSPIFLSDVSPAYKKIENYYLATIHTQLARLNITNENKALIDSFMRQLAELDEEYKRLNNELNTAGINEQTVAVLIENLQLRLDLLFKLKNKLNELKTSLDQKENKI